MKISKLFGSVKQRLAAGAVIALAMLIPVSASAASLVKIQANIRVAHAATNPKWGATVSASNGQVVDIAVAYVNAETAASGKVVSNPRVKIAIPSASGAKQVVTSKVSADNSNTVNSSATVAISSAGAYLQYIPGSATWSHFSAATGKVSDTRKISDDVVTNASGLRLENDKPGQVRLVKVEARVVTRNLVAYNYVRPNTKTGWQTSITAKPGDTIEYGVHFQNSGSVAQKNVMVRYQLPSGVSYVSGTTMLRNPAHPNGVKVASDTIATTGYNSQTFAPGASGAMIFNAKISATSGLACGKNTLRATVYVQPEGMQAVQSVATVVVNKVCQTLAPAPSSTPAPAGKKPVYSCDMLTVSQKDDRMVTASVAYTGQSGASFKSVTFAWGDETTPLAGSETSKTYQYAKDGTYTIVARVLFLVDGKDTYAPDTAKCVKQVTFTAATTATTPATPAAPATPSELPNTGVGNIVGIFFGAALTGMVAYRLFLSRKLAR